MSIYPDGINIKDLDFTFQIAAIDVPVPQSLTSKKDEQEWSQYLGYVSPAILLRKFSEAMQLFHDVKPANNDYTCLSDQKKEKVYAAWNVAQVAAYRALERFHILQDFDESKRLPDVERSLSFVIDLLQSVNSQDLQKWQDIYDTQRAIDKKKFSPFLSDMRQKIYDRREQRASADGNAPRP